MTSSFMKKIITKTNSLKILRNNAKSLASQPNIWRVLDFEKFEWNEDTDQVDPFIIKVSFQHPNYFSLSRDLYGSDGRGFIVDGVTTFDDETSIPYLKTRIEQLERDGFLYIGRQVCKYETEFGKVTEYDENGAHHEVYIKATRYFSESEMSHLETAIHLTTKGQNRGAFIADQIFSEPVGLLSLVISVIALVVSRL